MTFPVVEARASGATTGSTSHPITLPAGVVAGDLLAVVFSSDGEASVSINTGASGGNWRILGSATNGASVRGTVVWKIAEGSDALTLTTSATEGSSHVSLRISGATGLFGVSSNGSGSNSNPPLLDFGGRVLDRLWIATRSGDSTVVATVAPADFVELQTRAANDTSGASTNTAERSLAAASLDPDAFTSASEQWVSWTLAAYVVPQEIGVHKAVAYVTEQPEPNAVTHKAVAYVVEQPVTDNTGNARQASSDRRPVYRAGPIPYAQFDAGDFLTVVVTVAGTYTALFYKPDDTFEQQELTLAVGTNVIPVVDFNQLVIVPGVPTAGTVQGLQAGMRARVIPTAVP